jgi:hypothetical protein
VLVKGFHHHMERWYNKIQSRNQQIPNGETTDLKTLYTASDREELGDYVHTSSLQAWRSAHYSTYHSTWFYS